MAFGEVNSLTKVRYKGGELCLAVDHFNAAVIIEVLVSGYGFGISLIPHPSLEKKIKLLQTIKQTQVIKILE